MQGENWMTESILVTGGTGQIGAEIARQLVAVGHRVVVLDFNVNRTNITDIVDDVVVAQGDITDLSYLMKLARRENVTRVVHLAGYLTLESRADPMRATRVNIVGTGNVLDTAVVLDIERVCYASTISVFGVRGLHGVSVATEDSPTSPTDLYGASKRTVETVADLYRELYGLDVVGMRPVFTYGIGRLSGGAGSFNSMIRDVALGRPAVMNMTRELSSPFQLIYNTDMARAFVAATVGGPTPLAVYNAPVAETLTGQEVIGALQELVPGARISHEPLARGGETPLVDGSAAQRDLGVIPRMDFRSGAAEMIAWYREQEAHVA